LPEVDRFGALRFELRGQGTVSTEARVAWARSESTEGERGVGLAFDSIPESEKKKIRAYLDRLRELASEMDVAPQLT
jgi:c-di-GMP-binding flagellar brake protein YcgR